MVVSEPTVGLGMRRVALLVGMVVLAVAAVGCGSGRKGAATTARAATTAQHIGPAVVVVQRGYLVGFPLDGSKSERLAKLPGRAKWPGHEPAVSPDGSMVAFATNSGISTMRIDGSDIRAVTHQRYDETPSWSADGRRLYFVRACGEIFSVAASGDGLQRIIAPPKPRHRYEPRPDYEDPAASPDGTRIAFTEWDSHCEAAGTESPRLAVVDLDGQPTGDLKKLARNGYYPDPEHSTPAWSPDGTQIAYRRNADLAVANRDGTAERILIRGGISSYVHISDAPAWSPDGAWIAVTREAEGVATVVIVHPDGSNRRVIARVAGPGLDEPEPLAGWLPDS